MIKIKNCFLLTIILGGLISLLSPRIYGQNVRISTNLGNIDVQLTPSAAPQTVANFLSYVNSGRYNRSFIHRSVPNFIIQGGGYKYVSGNVQSIATFPPVVNEFNVSNTRGTLAAATVPGNPNSATSQWFFNTVNNPILDTQNGGFTVFGHTADAQSLAVMDAVAGVPNFDFGTPFDNLPLINYTSGPVSDSNFVTVYSIRVVSQIIRTPLDFDGDRKSDLSVFRPASGSWLYLRSSNNSYSGVQFGAAADNPAPADYDGDGRVDAAVWRESEGSFYILNSSNNSVRVENFGLAGDILTVGDWDGDGKADLSTHRGGAQNYFFYRGSSNNPNGNITYLPWGTSGDRPVRGDFDGDGKQDAAVYRASNQTWYILKSSDGQAVYQTFGLGSDQFAPADYDGDGRSDLAVFRPSNGIWYILQSSNNQVVYQQFGISGDTLAPADYDGDGKTDVAVFRNGAWFILQSTNGQVAYPQFGQAGDIPIASVLTP